MRRAFKHTPNVASPFERHPVYTFLPGSFCAMQQKCRLRCVPACFDPFDLYFDSHPGALFFVCQLGLL